MPTKSQIAAAAAAALPFAFDSTDPYAGRSDADRRKVAAAIRDAKLAGASGDEMRATFGPRLTGPTRRKVLREFGFDAGTIARSYEQYRDGDGRQGTRHAREHGAAAGERRAAARSDAEQALAEARKAPKGRTKASRAAHAERIAECEATLVAIG